MATKKVIKEKKVVVPKPKKTKSVKTTSVPTLALESKPTPTPSSTTRDDEESQGFPMVEGIQATGIIKETESAIHYKLANGTTTWVRR